MSTRKTPAAQKSKVIELKVVKRPKITQERLLELRAIQRITARSQKHQTLIAAEILRDLDGGADIEDGELYFDRDTLLAHLKASKKAVG